MNEYNNAARFLAWVFTLVLTLGLLYGMKPMALKAAKAAAKDQQHSMSYGKFSRQLWNKKTK